MLAEILGAAAIIYGIIALIYMLEGAGARREQDNRLQQVLDDIHQADLARDALDRDPAAAKRVRDRFTR